MSVRSADEQGYDANLLDPLVPGRGTPIGATELPPVPPAPTAVPRKPSSARLLLKGLLGAIVASGVAVAVALWFAQPDIPTEPTLATPSAAPDRLTVVEGLTVTQQGTWTADPGTWRLSVTWAPVEGATSYVISRDGRRIDETDATEYVTTRSRPRVDIGMRWSPLALA